MKRILVLTVSLVILLGIAQGTKACKITFKPEKLDGIVGQEKTVEVELKWEHRRCVLDEDDINMEFKGVTLTKQEGWKKVRSMLYRNALTVRLDEPGQGMIRVYRECSRKGLSEGKLKIEIGQTFEGALKDIAGLTLALEPALQKNDKKTIKQLTLRLEAEEKWLTKNLPQTSEAKALLLELGNALKALKALKGESPAPDLLSGLKKHKLVQKHVTVLLSKRASIASEND